MTIEYFICLDDKKLYGVVTADTLPRVGDDLDLADKGLDFRVVKVAHKLNPRGGKSIEGLELYNGEGRPIVFVEKR